MISILRRTNLYTIPKRNYSSTTKEEIGCKSTAAIKLREKTPIKELHQTQEHLCHEKEPLQGWPDGKNPNTGEVGGPKGPEPTRFGDWERKGRVSDF